MNRTLRLPLEPVDDASFVKLAEALEAGQLVTNLVVFHADRTFGDLPILTETVFLGGFELDHPRDGGWEGRGCRSLPRRGLLLRRCGAESLDAVADVRLARFDGLLVTDRRESSPADGAEVPLGDCRGAWWLLWGCYPRGSRPS